MKQTEHQIQSAYFAWLETQRFNGVELIHAVPNGGARHIVAATKLKKEGVKAGVPDVLFPAARGGYIGLAIEFKANDGNPSKEQRERITKMQLEGWCVILCWDWQAAARATQGYVGMLEIGYGD
jgi:hypothetical protein